MNGHYNVAERSAKLIYKDLIKMVKNALPEFKHKPVLMMLRREFDRNKYVTNLKEIQALKLNAGKAITDTYIHFVKEEYKSTKDYKERIKKKQESERI